MHEVMQYYVMLCYAMLWRGSMINSLGLWEGIQINDIIYACNTMYFMKCTKYVLYIYYFFDGRSNEIVVQKQLVNLFYYGLLWGRD